jgi:NAD(P)-dependent dehydrogenase (short-subunit alcohol dehydrogenase family)
MADHRLTSDLLPGRVVVVTGAARGFGEGIARGFALAGASVALFDVEADELEVTRAEIAANGGEAVPYLVDVSDFGQMQAAIDDVVARWGRLDVIVNNAAIMPLVPFIDLTPELWRKMIDINLNGVFNGIKAAWPHMARQSAGHCMAIASGSSVRGFVDETAYCAAKHGIEGFTKALAMEAEPFGIAVNTMGPGKRIKPTSVTRAQFAAMSPEQQAQWTDPIDLAPAFVWLAMQPPARFTGLRFDAGPLADTIAAEGFDFDFAPHKGTLYVADFEERVQFRRAWSRLPKSVQHGDAD